MYDPCFLIEDDRFRTLIYWGVRLEKLYSGCRWAEGPVYYPAGRYLLWSDIPNNCVLRWDETDRSISVFEPASNNANGSTLDREFRRVICEHLSRSVVRIEHDGSRTILAEQFDGKRLNSPNDVVVDSAGNIWFTDPSYGIDSDYEGDAAASETGCRGVYRVSASGEIMLMASDFVQPNGLAFSPDESRLYIVDSGFTHDPSGPRHVRVFNHEAGHLSGGEVLCSCEEGIFDGLRVDTKGHLWIAAGNGVQVFAPDGIRLGRIELPEPAANLCFGGAKRNRLFITANTSLYSVFVNANAAV